jgi:hypothetical protein
LRGGGGGRRRDFDRGLLSSHEDFMIVSYIRTYSLQIIFSVFYIIPADNRFL